MNFERKFQVFWEFFMHKNGYNVVVEGLKNTIIIAVMGLVIGIVLGTLIATARVVPKTNVFVKVLEKNRIVLCQPFQGHAHGCATFGFLLCFDAAFGVAYEFRRRGACCFRA